MKKTVGDMLAEHVKYEEMYEELETEIRLKEIYKRDRNLLERDKNEMLKDLKLYKWIIALMSLPVLFTLWCIIISIK